MMFSMISFLDIIIYIIALIFMLGSLALQLKYIRFKKKSFPVGAEVVQVTKRNFFWISELALIHEKVEYRVNLFETKAKDQVGSKIEVMYVPQDISYQDQSIVISKLLRKINLYFFEKPIVLKKDQNPLPFYFVIMLIGFTLALFV